MPHSPPLERLTFHALIERHAGILFDAYGVLVDAAGALPGAAEAIAALTKRRQPFLVVTNDASRSPHRAAQRYQRLGLAITPDQVLSSGMLIGPALRAHGLVGKRAVVLGTGDSAGYVREVGIEVMPANRSDPADAVVIADEGGVDSLAVLDELLSMILAAHAAGRPPVLLLANPDLIYPAGGGTFGFTAGALAQLIERALTLVLGDEAPRFEVLGKPATVHFENALTRIGTREVVMLGDTLHTDIAGARAVGIASGLLLTGVTTAAQLERATEHHPTYLLESLQ